MATLRVGLTGGLASGKSTVAARLATAGFHVVDADRLVAEIYMAGGGGAELVREQLGAEFLGADGTIDKVRVARRIFRDDDARRRLEAAIHPLVRERFAAIARDTNGVCVLEATKLVEAGYAPDFDLVVTVEASPTARLLRALGRGATEEDAQARMAAQASEAERRAAANVVIRNDGTREELDREVGRLIDDLRRRAAAAASAQPPNPA